MEFRETQSLPKPEDDSRKEEKAPQFDAIIINEVQLILAEKRTSLSAMRTGIAVFALPLSVLSLPIATSRYYDIVHVLPFLLPRLLLSTALAVPGAYLIIRAIFRIRHYDRLIMTIKRKHSRLGQFIS